MLARTIRFALLLSSLAVASLGLAQESLSLSARATSLSNLCDQLTAETGQVHRTTGRIGNLVVVVDVEDMDADEFRKNLAEAVAGEWQESGGEFVLRRTTATQNEIERGSLALHTARIQEKLAEKTEELGAIGWSNDDLEKMVEAEIEMRQNLINSVFNETNPLEEGSQVEFATSMSAAKSVSTIVLNSFLQQVDARQLAPIQPGDRIVFSTSPNMMQRPMPVNLNQAVAEYLQVFAQIQRIGAGSALPSNVSFTGGFELGRAAPASISKILTSVARMDSGDILLFQMTLLDPEGKVVSRLTDTVNLATMTEDTSESELNGSFTIDGASGEFLGVMKDIKNIRGNANEVRAVNVNAGGQMLSMSSQDAWRPLAISETVRPWVHEPRSNEPLSAFVSSALIGFARGQKKNLIAVPDDSVFWALADTLLPGENSFAKVHDSLKETFEFRDQDGTMVIVPKDRLESEANLISRAELQAVIKRVLNRGYAQLQDELDILKLKNSAPDRNDFAVVLLRLVDPDLSNRVASSGSVEFAQKRFLASLPGAARTPGNDPFQVTVSGLSPESKGWLNRMMFGRLTGAFVIGQGSIAVSITQDEGEQPARPVDSTEQYPNGVPGTAIVHVDRNVQDALFAMVNEERGRFFTASALGTYRSLSKSLPDFRDAPEYTQYRLADMLQINVSLRVQTESDDLLNASDFALRPSSPTLTWNQLPEDMRNQAAEAENRSTGVRFGGGRRVDPPLN